MRTQLLASAALALALAVSPAFAQEEPGQSEFAPGHLKGDDESAREFAPGYRALQSPEDDHATDYAPGLQDGDENGFAAQGRGQGVGGGNGNGPGNGNGGGNGNGNGNN